MNNQARLDSNSGGQSRLLGIAFGVVGMFAATAAQADLYKITAVQQGTSSGFGYSSFHDSSGADPRADGLGWAQETITLSSAGIYDDVAGFLSVNLVAGGETFVLEGSIGSFTGTGGTLSSTSTLGVDFGTEPTGVLGDTSIVLLPGFVCCGGTGNDPNTFVIGAGVGATGTMALWGANTTATASGSGPSGTYVYPGSTIGMDIRFTLEREIISDRPVVPIPAAAWLFGSALLGLFGVARRKQA